MVIDSFGVEIKPGDVILSISQKPLKKYLVTNIEKDETNPDFVDVTVLDLKDQNVLTVPAWKYKHQDVHTLANSYKLL